MKQGRLLALPLAAAIAAASWWVWHDRTAQDDAAASGGGSTYAVATQAQGAPAAAGAARGAALAGTSASPDSFLSPGLRERLEGLMLEAGEAGSPEELKQRLAGLVAKHFGGDAARAAQLVQRYVDYRVALSALQRPDPTNPDALRQTLNARRKIRERHFSPDEYNALFAQEEELDRFTIARLEIARDTGLTPQQKQAALREAEQQLSDAHRAARADTVLHQTVAAETAAFDAAGVDPQRRYELRRVAHGEAAAQQLAQLDREEQDWQARLARYAAAKAAGGTEQLETLKQQLFTAQEQMRLEAALALRATATR